MSVNRNVVVRGIVVGRAGAGEGSLRVFLYTDALGLVSALAKSAREERSKLRPHLQNGTYGTFSLVKGRDVWRITGATETANLYFALADKRRLKEAAARFLQSIRKFIHGEGADERVFETLWQFAHALAEFEENETPEAETLAVLKLLSALGYVEGNTRLAPFIESPYTKELLAEAKTSRAVLIQTVNDAIAASGL